MPDITLPSRITNTSSTLIDHIHSNSKQGSFISGLIYSCISDHMPIFNIGHKSKVGKSSKKEKQIKLGNVCQGTHHFLKII